MNARKSDEATERRSDEAVVYRAALELWEVIAQFAWREAQDVGKGVVLVDRDDLLGAAADHRRAVPMSFVPAGYIPRGDDFAPLINRYDPHRQVALLVGGGDDEQQLLILEPADGKRPSPPEC